MIKKDLLFIFTTLFTLVLVVMLARFAVVSDELNLSIKSIKTPKLAMSRDTCESSGGYWSSIKMNGNPDGQEWLFKCRCPEKLGSTWVSEGEFRTCR